MLLLILIIGLFIVLFGLLMLWGWISINQRDRTLKENGYFLGESIDEVMQKIGRPANQHPRHNNEIGFVWGVGNSSILLITDQERFVIDFRPGREDTQIIFDYFEKNKSKLLGCDIAEIEREIGVAHSYLQMDFGVSCYEWILDDRDIITVWTRRSICEEIQIKQNA